jgi:hypothetical protein
LQQICARQSGDGARACDEGVAEAERATVLPLCGGKVSDDGLRAPSLPQALHQNRTPL